MVVEEVVELDCMGDANCGGGAVGGGGGGDVVPCGGAGNDGFSN